MRWLAFFILAYLTLAIQLGLGSFIAIGEAVPNLLLVVAIFIIVNTPRPIGLNAALLLGLFQDLFGLYPLGLHALAFGVTALAILSVKQVFQRDHPVTNFFMALAGGLVCEVVMQVWHRLYPWLHGYAFVPARPGIFTSMLTAVYTAVAAVVLLPLLQRMRRVFAFERARRMDS